MLYVTKLNFVEDKKQKIMFLPNLETHYSTASMHSAKLADNLSKQSGVSKVTYNTFELGAKNWV